MRAAVILAIVVMLVGCGKVRYIPLETTRDVYITNHTRDSIYLRDSVTREVVRGDTVTITVTAFRYLYKDRFVRDTLRLRDSIPVRVPVPGPVTNVLTSWQGAQVWAGRLALMALAAWLGVRWIRKRIGL
ncbi:MAG: hypothetical protein LBK12_00695 [Odoribacteraceae bacterium]|jgi:hypothetical protein|nr:hypothetical protein [Odoribacteraceae bacterium]